MRALVLTAFLGTTALIPLGALAQTASPGPAPNQSPPADSAPQGPAAQQQQPLLVAPQALPTQADHQAQQTNPPVSTAGPANICQELVAYLQPKPAAGSPAAQPGAAQSAPAPQGPAVTNQGSASPAAAGRESAPPVTSGQAAPIPQATNPSPAPTITLDRAQALAQANDLSACKDAAQQMRRAGLAIPSSLIALAAAKLELLQQTQQR